MILGNRGLAEWGFWLVTIRSSLIPFGSLHRMLLLLLECCNRIVRNAISRQENFNEYKEVVKLPVF